MSTAVELERRERVAPKLESVLSRLRRGIRAYVWSDGIALLLIVLGLSFWLSLAFDWLFEPPAPLRVLLLVVAAGALGWVLLGAFWAGCSCRWPIAAWPCFWSADSASSRTAC